MENDQGEQTMTRNTPTVQDIAEDPGRLSGLPLAVLAQLTDEAKGLKVLADVASKAIGAEIENRFNDAIAFAYRNEGKDTGTVHVERDGFDIEAARTKKVEWDQAALAGLHSKITAQGDDPSEYLKVSYGVDERAYTAWPSHIRASFEPARTVRPGPLTIKLTPAKAESRAA